MMTPKIVEVVPHDDFSLLLVFDNGAEKLFDAKPYLEKGIFKELRDPHYFKKVKPFFGGVQWPHEQDFGPDTLYLEGKAVTEDIRLAAAVQKRLSEKSRAIKVSLDDL
jgi:Protein of unknown function (DUF2442)